MNYEFTRINKTNQIKPKMNLITIEILAPSNTTSKYYFFSTYKQKLMFQLLYIVILTSFSNEISLSVKKKKKKKTLSLSKKLFDMEDIITITGKYFFLYFTCTLDLSNIHTISLVVYFIIIYKIKKKIHYEFTTIKILDLANKRQRNTILANISYKLVSSHALRACDDAFFFFNLKKIMFLF